MLELPGALGNMACVLCHCQHRHGDMSPADVSDAEVATPPGPLPIRHQRGPQCARRRVMSCGEATWSPAA